MSLILVFTGCFFYLFPHFFRTKKKIIVQTTSYHFICKISWNTVSGWLQAGLRNSLHLCIRDARKWRENEEMKRSSLSTFTHYLFISSLSLHFLYLSKFVTFWQTLLLRMSQKTYYMRYEKIWVEFAARKLHKLCQPGWKPFSFLVLIEKAASVCT